MGNYPEDKVREQQAQSGKEREKQKQQILGNKRQKETDVKANNIFAWIVQYLGKISLKEKNDFNWGESVNWQFAESTLTIVGRKKSENEE